MDISRIPVTIKQEHCLHCGKCKEICPQKAIIQV
ncbi:4Fe-4S binding protein [Coprobacillaceae bacterium CR2/5/TPMF4]|nr:4Fe-4S binding protein [Coprobacillaceae bacterium CR2/5/TPMF4]